MSECYIIERFVETVAQWFVCVKALCARNRTEHLFYSIRVRDEVASWVSRHSMQSNTFMSKYCRYISAEFCRYDTLATSSYWPIYISVLIHQSSSTTYQGCGVRDTKELVVFQYSRIPENTKSRWQIFFWLWLWKSNRIIFLHHASKFGILVDMVQFLINFYWNREFLLCTTIFIDW